MLNFNELSKMNANFLAIRYLENDQSVAFFERDGHCLSNVSDLYFSYWEQIDYEMANYYSMVGLANAKTPTTKTRVFSTGHQFTVSTPNPEFWCFFADFEEALEALKSDTELQGQPKVVPFWKAA